MKEWSIQTCPRSVHPDWSLMSGPSRVETMPCPWCALDAEAPAPYTEPRDGDEVEVTVFGKVNRGGFIESDSCVDINSRVYVGADALRFHAHEGRVRLVKAAAPQFEAGRIYRSEAGETYLFSPDGELALSTSRWFRLSTGDWVQDTSVPSDLVPCDVVPREAT